MATGIANAIIYVRGVDMLTRPIQRALAESQRAVSKQQAQHRFALSKFNRLSEGATRAGQKFLDLDLSKTAKLNVLTAERGALLKREADLKAMLAAMPVRSKQTAAQKAAVLAYNDELSRIATQLPVIDAREKGINSVYNSRIALQSKLHSDLTRAAAEQVTIIKLEEARLTNLRKYSELQKSAAAWQQRGSAMGTYGLLTTSLISLPIAGLAVAAVKSYKDFDVSMRNIQSIGRQTDAEMKALSQTFISLSNDISKTTSSPKELAESFYEIQSAAYYGIDAQRILEASTKTASAGLADQKETAKAVAMALHAYGASTLEVGRYTDVMMRAVDIGIFRFEDLTQQMGDFIGAAGMMGVPIEEVMAALTTMTKKGVPIAEAATSLNRIMMNFLKPAKKEVELARQYGIELSANTLKTKGLAGAMTDLLEKTNGNEDALANLIGEVRGIRAAFALGSDGLKMYNEDLMALRNSAGTVDTVFATQAKSLEFKLKNLRNALSTVAIGFGEIIANSKAFNNALNFVKNLSTGMSGLSIETKNNVATWLGLTAALGPAMLGLSGLLNLIGKLVGAIATLRGIGLGVLPLFSMASFGAIGAIVAILAGLGVAIYGIVTALKLEREAEENAFKQDLARRAAVVTSAYNAQADALLAVVDAKKKYEDTMKARSATWAEKQSAAKEYGQSRINAQAEISNFRQIATEQIQYKMGTGLMKQLERGMNVIAYNFAESALNEGRTVLQGLQEYQQFMLENSGYRDPLIDEYINQLGELDKLLVSIQGDEYLAAYFENQSKQLGTIGSAVNDATKAYNRLREARKILNENPEAMYGPNWVPGFSNVQYEQPEKFDWILRMQNQLQELTAAYKDVKAAKEEATKPVASEYALGNFKAISDLRRILAETKDTGVDKTMYKEAEEAANGLSKAFDAVWQSFRHMKTAGQYGSALRYLRDNTVGASGSLEDMVEIINTWNWTMRKAAIEVLNTRDAIDALRRESLDPIVVQVKLAMDAFDQIEGMSEQWLGKKSITEIIGMETSMKDKYLAYMQPLIEAWQNGLITERQLVLEQKAWVEKYGTANSDALDVAKKLGDSAKKLDDAFSAGAGIIEGYLGQASDFSKGLGNLLPGGEKGMLAPGANGPFEALYRIQDIAMSASRGMGKDTQKYMDMYKLNPEQAAEIMKKVQMGIWDADVLKYVDKNALVDMARMQMIAEASKKALAEELAKASGLDQKIFESMFGLKKDKQGNMQWPTIDVNAFRTTIADDVGKLEPNTKIVEGIFGTNVDNMRQFAKDSLTMFAGQVTVAKDQVDLEAKGQEVWGQVGTGIVNAAKNDGRFKQAIYDFVIEYVKKDLEGKK